MSMFRDREADLSELQRLVVKLADPARHAELMPEEWPLAMVAYALHLSEDADLLSSSTLALYASFVQHAPAAARAAALSQLAGFITSRRGAGWRTLLLFALGEAQDAALGTRAATLTLQLAPPSPEERFTGAAALAEQLRQGGPAFMLSALLSAADLRLLPLLTPLCSLPPERMQALLTSLDTTLNSLSAALLLHILEAQPQLAGELTAALVRLAEHTPLVADLVYPIPTWAYGNPAPQPLHAWTLPEYLPRLLPRLTPHLSAPQIQMLRDAFV